MPNDRCAKPGCGALRLVGKPCTDRDCPQIWVHHTEVAHRERAAAAATWMAAREAAGNFVEQDMKQTAVNTLSEQPPSVLREAIVDMLREVGEALNAALLALSPPADAAAALAEMVRKAKEEAFEEAAQAVEGSTAVTLRLVDPHAQKAHGDDGYRDLRSAYAAAIRARGEGGE